MPAFLNLFVFTLTFIPVLILDIRLHGIHNHPYRLLVRLSCFLSALLIWVRLILFSDGNCPFPCSAPPLWGASMLLLTPLNGERNLPMLVAVSSMFVLSLAGLFLAESFVSEWMLAVIALSMVAGAFLRSWMRYKSVVTLFNNDSLKYGIRYEGTLVFSLIVIALCVLSSVRSEWLDIGAGFLSSLFFSFICLSRVLERSFVMSVRKENELATMLRGNLRNAEMTKDMCDGKMSLLYKKVLRLMKEDEIYTMENLDLDSMARMLYTNKVYLSRTINIMSGRNFCQFVSYYRVAKAVEIMKSSDRVRVEDIAYQVGFHSISSFNIAFKMFNGFTPREWLERYREGGL